MELRSLLFMCLLLAVHCSAGAQNCGPMPAVNGVCIPPDSPSSPLNSAYGQQHGQPMPQVVWADRWAAIAMDFTNAGVGTSTGMPNKRKAEKSAMAQCRAKGGSGCQIALVYHNQCGVIAWGVNYSTTFGGPTIEEAAKPAIEACSKHTTDCQIYYADCSYAERIQ